MSDGPPQPPSGWTPYGGDKPPPGDYQAPGGYGTPSGGYATQPPGVSQWGQLADWPTRALGILIDAAVSAAAVIVVLIVAAIVSSLSSTLGAIVFIVGYGGLLAIHLWFAFQVGQSGASPGMRVMGIRCIGESSGQPIGGGMGIVRSLAHIVDGIICYIGWLFPLWDAKRQTIADKILGTLVVTGAKQGFTLSPPQTRN